MDDVCIIKFSGSGMYSLSTFNAFLSLVSLATCCREFHSHRVGFKPLLLPTIKRDVLSIIIQFSFLPQKANVNHFSSELMNSECGSLATASDPSHEMETKIVLYLESHIGRFQRAPVQYMKIFYIHDRLRGFLNSLSRGAEY